MIRTVPGLLEAWAKQSPEATAILAPGRKATNYRGLCQQVEDTVRILQAMGVHRHDRVAIALPNGPEMAVAFLAVSSAATSAPLNPALGTEEVEFYLSDLGPRALIVKTGMDFPAADAARARGIPLLELSPILGAGAGVFELEGDHQGSEAVDDPAQPDDVALVLYTSGTTSRPKLVPLTHANLWTSAIYMKKTYELDESDRCLNVLPLFHIHGLAVAFLAPLAAGGSVVCTPSFDAARFFGWLDSFTPTWYSAVPTMHLAILGETEANQAILSRHSLQFICSQSAALPAPVLIRLEQAFGTPVLESYGLTETSSHVAGNRLPPQKRKMGSVGKAAGPEMAIMDEASNLVPATLTGEIVVRGENIFLGYDRNPKANTESFAGGWFRTGDQGYLDEDGYLFITGRIKEIINRGGEKVVPKEVDDALLEQPTVSQAATFAVPHPTLGEYVASAVVLRKGASSTEQQIRERALARLADYKVPSQVLILDQIPTGPTGKVQRTRLAEELAYALRPEFVAPRNEVEAALERIWADLLALEQVGVHANFFSLGGDSLLGMRMFAQIDEAFGAGLAAATLFQAPTIEKLAPIIQEHKAIDVEAWSSLVPMQPTGTKPPLFVMPGNLGNVFVDLGDLAQYLGPDQPFYGLQDWIRNPVRIEALAAQYLDEIQDVQPKGPFLLAGVCSGAIVAFEMAQQIQAQEQEVALLAMIEPPQPQNRRMLVYARFSAELLRRFGRRFGHHASSIAQEGISRRGEYLQLKMKVVANEWALLRYKPGPFAGRIDLFLSKESLRSANNPQLRWRDYALGGAEIHQVPGDHASITGLNSTPIEKAHMQVLAQQIQVCIDGARVNE